MLNETVLQIKLNDRHFGRNQAAAIVGGLQRLYLLIEQGKIRAEKRSNTQNGKWFCNAWDVINYAKL